MTTDDDDSEASARVDATVPAPVREVCAVLQAAGHEALTVGGAVRDALLGRTLGDWDVASSALPDAVMALFKKTIPTGVQHGTVTVVVGRGADRHSVEVTSYRGEGAYSDARRPDQVSFGVPLREDLARRDFVINAIAYDPIARRFHDPFGGRDDLAARRIRAVGDAAARFGEDGLRVMRAVRFAATLEFEMEAATEAAIPTALGALARVSWERVRDELGKLLGARRPSAGLAIARRTGVLAYVLPELAAALSDSRTELATWARVDGLSREAPLVRLVALLGAAAAPGEVAADAADPAATARTDAAARRLKLPNLDRERALVLSSFAQAWRCGPWADAAVRRLLGRIGRRHAAEVIALWRAELAPGVLSDEADAAAVQALANRAEQILAAGDALATGELAISGGDLMRLLAIPPGRDVGRLLVALLERVLVEPGLNQRDRLEALAPELLATLRE